MGQYTFTVSLEPREVRKLIENEEDADLIYEEINEIQDGKCFVTIVFEKYFMRVSSRVALVVLINNVSEGATKITAVSTGSSQGLFFNFDWGASDDFAYNVRDILKEYVLEDIEQ